MVMHTRLGESGFKAIRTVLTSEHDLEWSVKMSTSFGTQAIAAQARARFGGQMHTGRAQLRATRATGHSRPATQTRRNARKTKEPQRGKLLTCSPLDLTALANSWCRDEKVPPPTLLCQSPEHHQVIHQPFLSKKLHRTQPLGFNNP